MAVVRRSISRDLFLGLSQALNPVVGGGAAAGTPGLLTPGQAFTGSFGASEIPLDGADVDVAHNSWFTADIDSLSATNPSTPLVGAAWGSFTVTSGSGTLVGGYEALITGVVFIHPHCALVTGLPIAVSVDDVGGWQNVFAAGDYTSIGAGGGLAAHADGCLFAESVSLTVTGTTG